MCETAPRRWKDLYQPQRCVPAAAAVAAMAAGTAVSNHLVGAALIVAGMVLFSMVLLPAISRIEYGLPSGLKVTADLNSRNEQLSRVFESQRPIFEHCASLLCDDPDVARRLLDAAIAQATLKWRGPVQPAVQMFALCWFVHTLLAHSRLTWTGQPATGDTPLSRLPLIQRVVVVLSVLADVSVADIADMLGLTSAEVQSELHAAQGFLRPVAHQQERR